MFIMGYNSRLPQVGDLMTAEIKWITLFLYCGIPVLGWVCSLISMRYYTLDKRKMYEITQELHRESLGEKLRDKREEWKEHQKEHQIQKKIKKGE